MGHHVGRVTEIRFDASWQMEAFVQAPGLATPQAGQYLLAHAPDDRSEVLGTPIFATERGKGGFWVAPPISPAWIPGTSLDLVGPIGHGFSLPGGIQRLGLAAMGNTAARLKPVIDQLAASQTSMTLFTDLPLPKIPASLEAYPLAYLAEALEWPDFMIFDLPAERLPELRGLLRLSEGMDLPCPAQVLVTMPMPCAGMAQCGACAIPTHRGWKMVCEHGPAFDLRQIKW